MCRKEVQWVWVFEELAQKDAENIWKHKCSSPLPLHAGEDCQDLSYSIWFGFVEFGFGGNRRKWEDVDTPIVEDNINVKSLNYHSPCIRLLTKFHKVGGLTNRNVLPYGFGGWKSKIKVAAGVVSYEASLFGLWVADFLLCPHIAFPICVCILGVSSSYKDKNHTVLGPKHIILF